jgi:lysozyme
MTATLHPDGVALVRAFEGFHHLPYLCPALVWTIGYGATRGPDGSRVTPETAPICEDQSETLLARDLSAAADAVDRLVTAQINERQRAALASFAYNLGTGALRCSTLMRRVNERDWNDVPAQFMRWTFAGGRQLSGLMRRRRAEAELWLG